MRVKWGSATVARDLYHKAVAMRWGMYSQRRWQSSTAIVEERPADEDDPTGGEEAVKGGKGKGNRKLLCSDRAQTPGEETAGSEGQQTVTLPLTPSFLSEI